MLRYIRKKKKMGEYPHPFPPVRPRPGSLWKLLRTGLVHNGHKYKPYHIQLLPVDEPFVADFAVASGGFYLTPFEAIPRWLQIYDDLEFIAPARLGRSSKRIVSATRVKTDLFFLGGLQFLWKFIYDFFNPYDIILRNPYNIRFLRYDQTTVQMEDAVRADPHTLQYIYNPPIWISILAVEQNGLVLRHLHYKAPEVSLAAVKQNGLALAYVEKQYSKYQYIRAVELDPILIAAVTQNGMALAYVKDRIPQLCGIAVEQTPLALMYVPEQNKTFELCQSAYRRNPDMLRYIPDELKGRVCSEGKYKLAINKFVLH